MKHSRKIDTTPRVLVVDDDPSVLEALREALSENYAVDEVASGEAALASLSANPYDVMILDLYLPDIDGHEIMHQAHEQYPKLLIIILTGHSTLESAIAAVKAEAVDYLIKPVRPREIIKTVDLALRKRSEQLYQQQLVNITGQALDVLHQPEPVLKPPPTTPTMPSTQFVHASPLTLDRHKRLAVITTTNPPKTVHLTSSESSVLGTLMSNPEYTFTYKELAHTALGHKDLDDEGAKIVIRPHISRLRNKLKKIVSEPRLIRTVRGKGYCFDVIDGRYVKTPEE